MNIINAPLRQPERDPLGLSSLPPLEPPGDDWPLIRNALQERKRRRKRFIGGALAAAAVITLAVGISLRMPQVATPTAAPALAEAEPVTEAVSEADILDSLVALSQQLETQIRAHRERMGSTRADSLAYQVELEDLVVLVDEELSRDPESLQLWSQRVNLLLDINELYKNQLRRDYHNMASL